MFSDRGRLLKFLIPLGIFAALCADSAWRLGGRMPRLETVVSDPEAFAGRELWTPTAEVVETTADGIVIERRGARMKLRTPERPSVGSYVVARGRFNRDGTLTVSKIHESPNWKIQRGGIYGISAAVLLFFAVSFLRKFRFGWKGISPKAPAPAPEPEAAHG